MNEWYMMGFVRFFFSPFSQLWNTHTHTHTHTHTLSLSLSLTLSVCLVSKDNGPVDVNHIHSKASTLLCKTHLFIPRCNISYNILQYNNHYLCLSLLFTFYEGVGMGSYQEEDNRVKSGMSLYKSEQKKIILQD